jgi:RNA polymerase sigma factor (sigma-70 family)
MTPDEEHDLIKKVYFLCGKLARQGENSVDLAHEVWLMGRVQKVSDFLVWRRIQWDVWEYRRKQKVHNRDKPCGFIEDSPEHRSPRRLTDERELTANCLKKLKKADRHLIYNVYFKGMNQSEAGKKAGITRQRASQKLKRLLKRMSYEH